ncbi:MAG: hypothetical protein ACLQQ4_14530 [Bacteroidia bacterium]
MIKLKYKELSLIFLLALLITSYGIGQNMPPKIQSKLDSLYPKFRFVGGNVGIRNNKGNKEVVIIDCNCNEYGSEILITLDSNAIIISKEYEFYKFKNLPKPILRYIKKHTTQTSRFDSVNTSKIVYIKGEINYSFLIYDNGTRFIVTLSNNGKFLSKKEILPMKL